MIGRQIPLMTSQAIHIFPNDYSDVKTMIFILTRFNLVAQGPYSGRRRNLSLRKLCGGVSKFGIQANGVSRILTSN